MNFFQAAVAKLRSSKEPDRTESESGTTSGKERNDKVECLLRLRSVRDQFRDAELDLSHDRDAERLADLEDRLVDHLTEERGLRDGAGLLTVAVVGDFSSGKSTFINALLRTKLCPEAVEPTTASVTHFFHGDKQRFELERNGTRTSVGESKYRSMVRHSKDGDREAYVFHVSMDSPVLDHIRLVDTPGFNAPPPNSNDTGVTEQAVSTADALFVVVDAHKGNLSKTLLEQLDRLQNTRKEDSVPPAFLLINKAELIPPTARNATKIDLEKRYDGRFRDVALVSAKRLQGDDDAARIDALKTLENTARSIRTALSRQDSFEARISARVVTVRGQENYRIDIDGNEYETSVSSDGDLASHEQLFAMVRSVAAERHAVLERQFRRRRTQLRKDWMKVASGLDGLCKRAARISSGAGDATDGRGHEALQAIDDAKDRILEQVDAIFHEIAEDAVSKGRTQIPRFWSDKTIYHIEVRLDTACGVAENHDNWGRVNTIVKNLIDSLKRITDVGTVPDPDELGSVLRERVVRIVRDWIDETYWELEESEGWERQGGKCLRFVFEDEETLRDDGYDTMAFAFESDADQKTLVFAQYLQPTIDKLKETIIRYDEKGQASLRERNDELAKLRERIDELKEYTP